MNSLWGAVTADPTIGPGYRRLMHRGRPASLTAPLGAMSMVRSSFRISPAHVYFRKPCRRAGDHTTHFDFRNAAVKRRGSFGRPACFQNVVHHPIGHALDPASIGFLTDGQRKRRPLYYLDRHQARCAPDSGRAVTPIRKSRRCVGGEASGTSARCCDITHPAAKILRTLRMLQARQHRPCGGSIHSRTRSVKVTT
jgi:hypothetical protein